MCAGAWWYAATWCPLGNLTVVTRQCDEAWSDAMRGMHAENHAAQGHARGGSVRDLRPAWFPQASARGVGQGVAVEFAEDPRFKSL